MVFRLGKQVSFKPIAVIVNGIGFILGFFFSNLLIPIADAVIGFISGGGEFPTQSIMGPVANMSGPLSLIIIGIIGIMAILLLKKVVGFALWLLVGLLLHAILSASGIVVPSLTDIISGIFGVQLF